MWDYKVHTGCRQWHKGENEQVTRNGGCWKKATQRRWPLTWNLPNQGAEGTKQEEWDDPVCLWSLRYDGEEGQQQMAKGLTTVPGSRASFFRTDYRVGPSKFLRALPDFKETEMTQPLYYILSALVLYLLFLKYLLFAKILSLKTRQFHRGKRHVKRLITELHSRYYNKNTCFLLPVDLKNNKSSGNSWVLTQKWWRS